MHKNKSKYICMLLILEYRSKKIYVCKELSYAFKGVSIRENKFKAVYGGCYVI